MAAGITDSVAAQGLVAGSRRHGGLLRVGLPSIADPAAFFVAERVPVSPVHQTAELVPLVHAAHVHAIAHADRDALGKIDVVRDQQGLAIADVDDETLVTRTIVVITQQAADEACDFDPPPVIAFGEVDTSSP